MSWKITKKLKETHLAPTISNPFSRSSSTSTIIPSDSEASSDNSESVSSGNSVVNDFVAPEPAADVRVAPSKPGFLILTIHEGQGFGLGWENTALFLNQQPPTDEDLNEYAKRLEKYESEHPEQAKSPSLWDLVTPRPKSGAGLPDTSSGLLNSVPTLHGRYHSRYLPYALVDFEKQQFFVNGVSGSPENTFWAGNSTQYKFDVSRKTSLDISVYIRNPNAPANAGRHKDFLIGTGRIKPCFEELREVVDPKTGAVTTQKPRGGGCSGENWIEVFHPIVHGHEKLSNYPRRGGKIKVGIRFVENAQKSLKMDDFDLLKVVGKGSFGKVMQVRKKDTHRVYALKTLRKNHIIQRAEVPHTLAERSVLAQINNPFIVPLKFSFQSETKLYLVLAFVNGGELFYHLTQLGHFHINVARFFAAELLCALECLHGFNVIYRDLKPENILLDYSGHIALCDFGLCKLDMKDGDKTRTFCGTPEYLAPELLQGAGYTKSVDWWTLGTLLYEMISGLPPYYSENTNEMYNKIVSAPLEFPSKNFQQDGTKLNWPENAIDLLQKLLDRRPDQRLGAKGAEDIKAADFFTNIDWRKLLARKYESPFKPNVKDQLDTTNFDDEFTSEPPTDSYVEGPMLSSTMQQQFEGWSYNRPVAGLGDAGGSVKDPSFGSIAS